jgi:hypothetical protein
MTRKSLDLPHPVAVTTLHNFRDFDIEVCVRVHEPFIRLTYAVPALEHFLRHSSTTYHNVHHMVCFFGDGMPSLGGSVLECLAWPNFCNHVVNSNDLGPNLSILESCANVESLMLLNESS